jgi:hypothetical protein
MGTLDLMLTFVEMGTQFTAQYGDIDEPFYEGLELMLDDFRDLLLDHPHLYEEGDFSLRLPVPFKNLDRGQNHLEKLVLKTPKQSIGGNHV